MISNVKKICIVVMIFGAFWIGADLYDTKINNKKCNVSLSYSGINGHYPKKFRPIQDINYYRKGKWDKIDLPRDFFKSPYSVIDRPEGDQSLKIVAVGDIMAHADLQLTAFVQKNDMKKVHNGYDWIFSKLASIITNSDLTIGNLETPISPTQPRSGFPFFNADPLYLKALKNFGFDVLCTANNHAIDQGEKGIEETVNEMAKSGLLPVGAGDKHDKKNHHVMQSIGSANKIRVAVINYTLYINPNYSKIIDYMLGEQSVNYAYSGSKKDFTYFLWVLGKKAFNLNIALNQDEFLNKVNQDINDIKKRGAEYIIIYLHWGREYHVTPTIAQRKLSLELCRSGADMILGSGPHIVQPFEKVYTKNGEILTEYEPNSKEHFIAYSLGNFVSHQRGVSKFGMVLEIILTKEERDGIYIQKVRPHFVKSVMKNEDYISNNRVRSMNTYQLHSVSFSEFIDFLK